MYSVHGMCEELSQRRIMTNSIQGNDGGIYHLLSGEDFFYKLLNSMVDELPAPKKKK